jgi:hypothetical protein
MRGLEAADVLALWERGAMRHPLDRSAMLVAAARPDIAPEAIAELPLGTVTASLLGLRTASFGARIASHVDCERCGQRLELELDARTLLQPEADDDAALRVVEVAGLRVRVPCLRDLAAIADAADPARAVRRLLVRCTLSGDGERVSDDALREVEDALEALDPNADLAIALRCVVCGHEGSAELDAGTLLWDEIEARAQALLREVHQLARAYGWSEAQILGLGAARRASYLAMVGA